MNSPEKENFNDSNNKTVPAENPQIVPLTPNKKSQEHGNFISRLMWGSDSSEYITKTLSFIADDFNGKILEIPASSCKYTTEKYKKLSGAQITVFDISEEALEQTKQEFELAQLRYTEYNVGDTGRLKYADNTFDLIVCLNGMHTFADNTSAFLEISRVLKKGGQFCGTMYLKNQNVITDFIVSMIHVNKGSLTPPFYNKKEIEKMFGKHFSKIDIIGEKSIVCFNCIK